MKHLNWDLLFDEKGIHALTERGNSFLGFEKGGIMSFGGDESYSDTYHRAVRENVKVSFSSAEIRNKILDGRD